MLGRCFEVFLGARLRCVSGRSWTCWAAQVVANLGQPRPLVHFQHVHHCFYVGWHGDERQEAEQQQA